MLVEEIEIEVQVPKELQDTEPFDIEVNGNHYQYLYVKMGLNYKHHEFYPIDLDSYKPYQIEAIKDYCEKYQKFYFKSL